jgi:hypothetical protein
MDCRVKLGENDSKNPIQSAFFVGRTTPIPHNDFGIVRDGSGLIGPPRLATSSLRIRLPGCACGYLPRAASEPLVNATT